MNPEYLAPLPGNMEDQELGQIVEADDPDLLLLNTRSRVEIPFSA